MENSQIPQLSVSDFIALTNQTLEYSFASVVIEGEVAGFKVNQNKYVFFDLKDETGSIGCFMTVWQLRTPIEDGMKIVVTATPKLTDWGKFSLTVRAMRPSGEGNLKRSADLLLAKLEKEGLFAPERKRPLPVMPSRIAVISSTQAAGYVDFMKILSDRWGGLTVEVAHVQVQGREAPDQMVRALRYFNSREELPEVIVLIRGGGSADDLSAFNDELLVREIAASRIPTLVGVGHETDTSLADLAADRRAATPSNAAQLVVPDRRDVLKGVRRHMGSLVPLVEHAIDQRHEDVAAHLQQMYELLQSKHEQTARELRYRRGILGQLDPEKVLARGYALIQGILEPGNLITIETLNRRATAEVRHVSKK